MADFPTTPVNGDTHVIATSTWEYYSSTDRWEIQDTSGVPQQATTLLYTLTPSAGDVTVESGSINYSDYTTIIVTYAGIASDTADTQFQFAKSISEIHTSSAAEPRIYTAGDGTLVMSGTTTILPSTGTANSNTTINTTITDVENLSVIGADFSTLIFGWESNITTFAAGGTIEIRGVSLLIAADQLEHLGNVQDVIPQSGDYLAWNGTAWIASDVSVSYASLTGKPTTLAGYGITDSYDGTYASLTGKPTTLAGYGITDSLESLSNVDTTTPTDGQVLTWDNTNSYWKPTAPASGGGGLQFASVQGPTSNVTLDDDEGDEAFGGFLNWNEISTYGFNVVQTPVFSTSEKKLVFYRMITGAGITANSLSADNWIAKSLKVFQGIPGGTNAQEVRRGTGSLFEIMYQDLTSFENAFRNKLSSENHPALNEAAMGTVVEPNEVLWILFGPVNGDNRQGSATINTNNVTLETWC